MIRLIIAQILSYISALNFADRVAGIVLPISKKVFDENNNPFTKIFPVYGNDPTVCEGGDYILLVPDEKFKSIIYFEEMSTTILTQDNWTYTMESDVRLVGWFNLKKIAVTADSDTLLRLILQAIPDSVADFGDMFNIVIRLTGIENKNPSLFSSYTYDEAETQYLIFPYEYGALRFTVSYKMNKCLDDISVADNCGKK